MYVSLRPMSARGLHAPSEASHTAEADLVLGAQAPRAPPLQAQTFYLGITSTSC
jgi:hypothetical protein